MKRSFFRRIAGIAVIGGVLSGALIGQTAGPDASGISTALKQRITTAHSTWQRREAAGLNATLSVAYGKPTLFFTFITEQGPQRSQETSSRQLAIVTALDFLLADDAFAQARLSITEYSLNKASGRTLAEYDITRAQFQAATTGITRSQSSKDAVKNARRDKGILSEICARLGIK
jgi:hypothetical protein